MIFLALPFIRTGHKNKVISVNNTFIKTFLNFVLTALKIEADSGTDPPGTEDESDLLISSCGIKLYRLIFDSACHE